jgi:hypothetical protein
MPEYIYTARPDMPEGVATMVCWSPRHQWWYFPDMQTGMCVSCDISSVVACPR